MAQMVEKLQARVRQLKAENGQLEELVHAAEQKAGDAAVQVLEQRVQKLQRSQRKRPVPKWQRPWLTAPMIR